MVSLDWPRAADVWRTFVCVSLLFGLTPSVAVGAAHLSKARAEQYLTNLVGRAPTHVGPFVIEFITNEVDKLRRSAPAPKVAQLTITHTTFH